MSLLRRGSLLMGLTLLGVTTAHLAQAQQTAFALANSGSQLIRFSTSNPGSVTVVGNLFGDIASLDGMDFRPANGQLYGYADATDSVYLINPATAEARLVSTLNNGTTTSTLGVDFNPVPDRLRIVNVNDENLRANVANGVTLVDGTLKYDDTTADGDPIDANAGVNPNIVDAAYINNDNNPATGTQLFYLDSALDILATTANPNGGILETVGALGVDTSDFAGLDIFTNSNGNNTAYAILTTTNGSGLYTINPMTGAATLVGGLNAGQIRGLAVAQTPEPGSLALLVGIAVFSGLVLRRRTRGA